MASSSRSDATGPAKSNNNDNLTTPTSKTQSSAPVTPTPSAASRSQLSDTSTSLSALSSTPQSSNATLADLPSPANKSGAASSPGIEVLDVLSTAAQAIRLASPTPGGTSTTRLSSSSASTAATPTPGTPSPSTTSAMGSAAHPRDSSHRAATPQQGDTQPNAPLHRPQAYPPLSTLPLVKLVPEEARIHAIEERYSEMTSSCYELPINGPDGKKALDVIPGMFNPCVPRKKYVFGAPATVHPRHVSFQKPIWTEYGWARQEDLAGYGSDSRPPPEHVGPNVTNDELDADPTLCFQVETLRYIPEWASDYPFAMLYDPTLGFAFPLVDLHEEAKLGGPPLPFPNHWGAQYLGLAFAPFDPFDLGVVDPRVESTPWGQHPARIGKLNREIDRKEAGALAAVMRVFG